MAAPPNWYSPRDSSFEPIARAIDATPVKVPVVAARHTGQPGSGTFDPDCATRGAAT